MERRNFLKAGVISAGSVASLLALTGQSQYAAAQELASALRRRPAARGDFLVLDPASPQFRGLTQGFNRRWTAPNVRRIYVPLTEYGAQQALARTFADGYSGSFRVRGGGHCYEDFVYNPNVQALIDVSLLQDIGYDKEHDVYFAQSGATTWDLYRQLYWHFGKTLPAGSCYSVGLGGHICGGGYGLLSRKFGLTVDWLSGIHVVTADSGTPVLRYVSRSSTDPKDRLLYWAHTGGGGGNFGIITRYEFEKLPDAPQNAEVLTLSWDWHDIIAAGSSSALNDIIHCFQEISSTFSDDTFGLLKLQHKQAGSIAIVLQTIYNGSVGSVSIRPQIMSAVMRHRLPKLAAVNGPMLGHPVNLPSSSSQVHYRWWESVQAMNGSGGNAKGKYKSAYMRRNFPEAQVQIIYKYLTQNRVDVSGKPVDLSSSLLQVDTYGGAINTMPPTATAVPQRSSFMKLQYQTYWQDPDEGESIQGNGHIAWIRDFYTEMYASAGGIPDPLADATSNFDGCYVNYPDTDLNDYGLATALRLYYGDNFPALIEAKKRWDPSNIFHHSQSIPTSLHF